jgi:serine protease Do
VGSNAEIKILRGGKTLTLTAKLEELPAENKQPKTPGDVEPRNDDGDAPTALGLRLRALTPDLAARFGLKENSKGVVVLDESDDSPAAEAGVQAGDIIERVGQTPVSTPQEVQAAIKSILDLQTEDKGVALYINRKGDRRFVIVDVK